MFKLKLFLEIQINFVRIKLTIEKNLHTNQQRYKLWKSIVQKQRKKR